VLVCSCDAGLCRNPLGRVISPFFYAFSTQSLKTQQSSMARPRTLWYGQKLGSSDLSASSGFLLAGRDMPFFTAPKGVRIILLLSLLKEYNLFFFCPF
jgi:hypothetical protein